MKKIFNFVTVISLLFVAFSFSSCSSLTEPDYVKNVTVDLAAKFGDKISGVDIALGIDTKDGMVCGKTIYMERTKEGIQITLEEPRKRRLWATLSLDGTNLKITTYDQFFSITIHILDGSANELGHVHYSNEEVDQIEGRVVVY